MTAGAETVPNRPDATNPAAPVPPPFTVGVLGVQGILDLAAAMPPEPVPPAPSSAAAVVPPADGPAPTDESAWVTIPGPVPATLAGATVVSFEDLARELAARKVRRKGATTVPAGQISLFGP